ncbi:RNA polymerase sigma factor [Faecalimonas sp.]
MIVYLKTLETPEEKLKFEELYFLYKDKMYAIAFKILHNENDAEDIVHESFKAIIEHFEKINDISCHKTWNYIVTIVKNKSFTLYQKKKHQETSSYEDWTEVEMNFTPEKVTEERELAEILAELIRNLPFPYKEVLYLQYYNSLSGEEIAKFIDKTPAHVRKISQRAKAMVKEELLKRGIQNE